MDKYLVALIHGLICHCQLLGHHNVRPPLFFQRLVRYTPKISALYLDRRLQKWLRRKIPKFYEADGVRSKNIPKGLF